MIGIDTTRACCIFQVVCIFYISNDLKKCHFIFFIPFDVLKLIILVVFFSPKCTYIDKRTLYMYIMTVNTYFFIF